MENLQILAFLVYSVGVIIFFYFTLKRCEDIEKKQDVVTKENQELKMKTIDLGDDVKKIQNQLSNLENLNIYEKQKEHFCRIQECQMKIVELEGKDINRGKQLARLINEHQPKKITKRSARDKKNYNGVR